MLNRWIAKGDINNFVDEEKMGELMSAFGDDDDDMATDIEDDDVLTWSTIYSRIWQGF